MPGLSFTRRRILLTAIILPFAIIYGIAGWIGWTSYQMVRQMRNHPWRTPTRILSTVSKSEPLLEVYGPDWRTTTPVKIDELPDEVKNAFLAAEDVRFRHHFGIDPIGMLRALVADLRAGAIEQGGSTIDQQIVKARALSNERSFRRKLLEIPMALVLDRELTKDEILEAYLNDVYLGHYHGRPILGIDEGARLLFDKKPSRLRPGEAAVLAGMIRAPNRDTPEKRPELARERRDAILKVMRDRHWLSTEQYQDAIERPVRLHEGVLEETPFPYYLAALRAELVDRLGDDALTTTGLRIVAEIDPRAQKAAEEAVRRGLRSLRSRFSWIRNDQDPLQSALLAVDPRSGAVRALVGGGDFHQSRFDRTSQMKRQPGSAFKTFAYAAAIASKKVTPASLLLDAPLEIELSGNDVWSPHNYDERFRGRVTVREAFEKSLNVPTIRLSRQIGTGKIIREAKKFGFPEHFDDVASLALGVTEVSVRDLTAAYTAFPNLGERVEPYLLDEVRDRHDEVLYQHHVEKHRVCNADVAYVMHSLLRGVVRHGTASRVSRYGIANAAGKTGTTNDYRDAWFVGYTPDLVATVWVGYDRGAPLRLSSAEAALPIWGRFMGNVEHSSRTIEPPDGVVFRDIDPETGFLWAEGCPGPEEEVFLEGTAPTHHCPRGVAGRIVRSLFFDRKSFDEPPAITFQKFRRWSQEMSRTRERVKGVLRRIFGNNDSDE
ncbi:MAG: PBP1A family penicillin-binding protein [Thermoanaerobaculia bacterium]